MSKLQEQITTNVPVDTTDVSPEIKIKLARLLKQLSGEAKVHTAPSGTQYILPIEILLSTEVLAEMQRLTDAVRNHEETSTTQHQVHDEKVNP